MKQQHHKTSQIGSSAGFTLVEMAIVMMIAGMIMLVGAGLIKLSLYQARFDRTIENIELTEAAINEFYGLQGRYPCPADPALVPGDAGYGQEMCWADPAVDPCPAGIVCTTQDARDADGDLNPDIVLIGMIPVTTLLQLDANGNPLGIVDTPFVAKDIYDGFDTRFTYGVTRSMTIGSPTDPANIHLGAISIVDENTDSVLDPPGSAHYAIASHGDNSRGGYKRNGNRIPSCFYGANIGDPEGPPLPGVDTDNAPREIENCDYNDAIFRQGIRSLVDGRNYNDDIVYYKATGLLSLWRRALGDDTAITNTNLGNVGVGVDSPAPEAKLHILDDLSAENGILAVNYCSGTDTDCLPAAAIGGDLDSMRCGTGQVAFAIENNIIQCRNVFNEPPTNESCSVGEYVIGLSYNTTSGVSIICGVLSP